ncbi:hypothetical protein WN51_04863 [Melipona quadrifasciata]|uniref:Uncharacterized protein n=1 Tax=Melipona quadrifasciata TaxID=166423 RepID=A0A0M8ZUX7_9HYME|nr:hypothetical protein WN51_04863 [Melipona quadrifasciata]
MDYSIIPCQDAFECLFARVHSWPVCNKPLNNINLNEFKYFMKVYYLQEVGDSFHFIRGLFRGILRPSELHRLHFFSHMEELFNFCYNFGVLWNNLVLKLPQDSDFTIPIDILPNKISCKYSKNRAYIHIYKQSSSSRNSMVRGQFSNGQHLSCDTLRTEQKDSYRLQISKNSSNFNDGVKLD